MKHLRLLTANLKHGRALPAPLQRLLADLEVDIACFQELGARQAAAIAEVLPHGKLEPGRNDRDHNGMGIAMRRPGEVQHLPLPKRDARVARLRPEEWPVLAAPIELLNVHVQAPHVRPWSALPLRRAQLRGLVAYLDVTPAPHRALVGDFNSTPSWPFYRRLAERLADAHAAHADARGQKPRPTWGPWSGSRRLLRIDHVLLEGLGPVHCEVLPVPGSDHSALLIDLEQQG